MIHATRPFILSEWIQTKIDGYEVSGTVEHVGWWSPTIITGDDRDAIHIPNHKFTVNVVRNLTQKTHWRIKTHLAITHLDVNKMNNIVADMRKVLVKNPQVEQKRLHRRVFLDNVDRENQALLIMVSCFVKTSHFEEYLGVKFYSVPFALIIDGKTLTYALEEDLRHQFLNLGVDCASVICCRVSPKQKALVTRLVKEGTGKTTLAIGPFTCLS